MTARVGSSAFVIVASFVLASCSGGSDGMHCGGTGVSAGTTNVTTSWTMCPDSLDRRIECNAAAPGPGAAFTCVCSVGGTTGRSFQTTTPSSISAGTAEGTAIANRECGWSLVP